MRRLKADRVYLRSAMGGAGAMGGGAPGGDDDVSS